MANCSSRKQEDLSSRVRSCEELASKIEKLLSQKAFPAETGPLCFSCHNDPSSYQNRFGCSQCLVSIRALKNFQGPSPEMGTSVQEALLIAKKFKKAKIERPSTVIEIELLKAKIDQLVLDNKELHSTTEDCKAIIQEMGRVIMDQRKENSGLKEQIKKTEAQLLSNSGKLSKEHMNTTSSFQNPSADYSTLKQACDNKIHKCIGFVTSFLAEYEEHLVSYEVPSRFGHFGNVNGQRELGYLAEENKELRKLCESSLSNFVFPKRNGDSLAVNKDVEANQEVALIGASIEEYLETLSSPRSH